MQQRRRLPHQVALIGGNIGLVAGDGERAAARGDRDVVEEREGLEDGLQIVVPVGPRSEDTQVQVDLRERGEADRSHSLATGYWLLLFFRKRRERSQFI